MRVRNENIGTPMLSHYCPSCNNEVFNKDTELDTDSMNFKKKCEHCGVELEFPNTGGLIKLLGL